MMAAPHVPVLRQEAIDLLQPEPGRRYIDGTFGFGGHTASLLAAGAEVLALDLDAAAFAACRTLAADQPHLRCVQASFRTMAAAARAAGWSDLDGVLLDLGVSSLQLDDPAKGFSYRAGGPLDMRFDQAAGETAAALLARLDERALAELLWSYGEEKASRRIARALVSARDAGPIDTTDRLRDVVLGALPRGAKPMPALSRVFQALRIAVNDELGALEEALGALPGLLRPGGRCVVISYHSLEDRLVKRFIDRERRDCICPADVPVCRCGHIRTLRALTRGALAAGTAETDANPRARSARLRAAERV